MKTVILAGGLGTRISEETHLRPKPMIELGGMPILWHIMKIYSAYGLTDFIICCGYKGYMVKEYFANYFLHMSDVTFDFADNRMIVHEKKAEPWKVTLVDTGDDTQTGGRMKRIGKYLDDDSFCFTYGDGVSNVNIKELIAFHRQQDTLATVTAIQPIGRFGELDVKNDKIVRFEEKPKSCGSWISGGYFVLSPKVLDYIEDDLTIWEKQPIEQLAEEGQLSAYKHTGFWKPMDTLRDKIALEELWQSQKAPWKIW